jgi:serine/threonine protein kinase
MRAMLDTASVTLIPRPLGGAADRAAAEFPAEPGELDITTQDPVVYPSASSIARAVEVGRIEEAKTVDAPEMATTPDAAASVKVLFGRYRLQRELGRGGMGVVWLAHDQVLGIPVALKLLPEALARSAEDLEGLRKEVLRGIALTHPGIVRVYSFERDATSAAIVMEYVDGESLADLKARQPDQCYEPEQLRPWLEQLCAVLDYAHQEARIAHRDLKPRNLMITREGRLKVADFGIASSLAETNANISIRNDSSGTPPYMSPQQAMGDRPAVADDIYSVGATFYDLLTGKPPFYRGNIIAQVLQEPADSLNARRAELEITGRPEISSQWERMIAACLAKNPAHRPPSGAALLELLNLSPHALIPFMPREEIKVETLRLDLAPVVRPSLEPQTGEAVDIPAEVVELRPWQTKVLQPEEPSGIVTFFAALRDEVFLWFRRVFYVASIIAVFIGVFYLINAWNRMQDEADSRVVNIPGAPPVVLQGPPQTVRVEVHYQQPPNPPPQMVIVPPPGFQPPPPPPPGGPGGPGGPPPFGGPPPGPRR